MNENGCEKKITTMQKAKLVLKSAKFDIIELFYESSLMIFNAIKFLICGAGSITRLTMLIVIALHFKSIVMAFHFKSIVISCISNLLSFILLT